MTGLTVLSVLAVLGLVRLAGDTVSYAERVAWFLTPIFVVFGLGFLLILETQRGDRIVQVRFSANFVVARRRNI